MAENEKQTNKDRLKDITDSIERGIQDLFQSDKYAQYLRTMSRFHKYSVNNTMLIYMQKPDATLVAGFNKWRDQFGRNVMKGEKGIKIIAPTPFKKKIEQEKRDPDTNLPMLDADGKVIIEEKEIKIPMYKPVTVFDVSQTDGKPLPQLASDLSGNVQNYEVFMEALRRSSPVPIEIIPIRDGSDGYFSLDNQKIAIREGMSEVQTVSAVVHEIGHAKLHNQKKIEEPKNAPKYQEVEIFDIPALFSNGRISLADLPEGLYRYDLRGSDDDPGMPVTVEQNVAVNHAGAIITAKPLDLGEDGRLYLTEEEGLNFVGGEISMQRFFNEQQKDRNTEEVEAESISFAVCAYYGIETGENSFGYIATWSKDKELKELRASLETINSTSSELITDIDRHYADIMKEREAALTITEPVLQTETEEALYLVDDTVYLHVQPTDGGWDYSLYDKETKKLLNGGVIETAAIEESPVSSVAGAVRTEVFAIQGMTPTKVTFEDVALVDDLQAAQLPEVQTVESGTITTDAKENTGDDSQKNNTGDTIDEIARKVQEEEPVKAPGNGYMPDPSMSIEAMNAYGYTDSDMLPLSKERALELFERDVPIYMLYDGNTEAMAFEAEDIVLFSGCFGITREDWDAIKDQIPPMDMETVRQKREQAFHESPGDTYAIYQLKRDPSTAELSFMNSEWLQAHGIEPKYENYELIYTGALTQDGSQIDKLEDLYRIFNIEHPQDFTGHSLSISDIVALKQAGVVSYHYVDSIGYKELTNFRNTANHLKNAEMQMEDDYGMIDGVINNAPKEPVKAPAPKKEETKTKKPSVLAKLRQYQEEDRKATTQHRSAERDL